MSLSRSLLLDGLKDARFHVQLAPEAGGSAAAERRFRVVRVFRGADALAPGDSVEVVVGPDVRLRAPSGEVRDRRALSEAACIEAFLVGDPPRCRLAFAEVTLLEAPTEAPQMAMPLAYEEDRPLWAKVLAAFGRGREGG